MELIRATVRLIIVGTVRGADLSKMYLFLDENRSLLGEQRYFRLLGWLASQELDRIWQTEETRVC